MNQPAPQDLLTRKEAASLLGVTLRTLDRYHQQGRLRAIKQENSQDNGRASILFPRPDVAQLYASLMQERHLQQSIRERAKESAKRKERERASRLVRFQLEQEELAHLKASAKEAGETMGAHARRLMKDRLYGGADDLEAQLSEQERKLREALAQMEMQQNEVEAIRTSLVEVLSFLLSKATSESRDKAREKLKELFPPRKEE